jgi:hypothetical protein
MNLFKPGDTMKHLSNYQVIQTLTDRQKDAIIRYEIEDYTRFLNSYRYLRLNDGVVRGCIAALVCLAISFSFPLVAKEIERWSVRELAKL